MLQDGIFGQENFRNEIVWQRTSSHNDSKKWGSVNDTIFFYSKGDDYVWNPVFTGHEAKYVADFYRLKDERGIYRLDHIIRSASMGPRPNLAYEYKGYTPQWGWRMVRGKLEALDKDGRIQWSKSGRPYLKRYLDEQKGTAIKSNITDIPPIGAQAQERLGYPTQKPQGLLERIIEASSNKGDIVLDPFCGCGTTVHAAQKLGRQWIGIDVTYPYAHRPLVEFLQAIPLEQLLRPGENRFLMRRMMVGILPDEIAKRRTKGNPREAIFRAIARESDRLRSVFENARVCARGYVDKEPLLTALDRAKHGFESHSAFLVQTITLEFWLRGLENRRSFARNLVVVPKRGSWASVARSVPGAV